MKNPTEDPAGPHPADTQITWIGHSTFLVEAAGLRILTDPVWASRLPMRLGRVAPPAIDWRDLPPIDAVVISHDHADHLHLPTLRRLPRSTPLLVPLRTGEKLRREGFLDVREHAWWQRQTIGDIAFTFAPARHWTGGGWTLRQRPLAGSWILQPSQRGGILFAGDTGLGPHFQTIGREHPDLDLALLPIGSYTPHWGLGHVHMNPEEAVQAFLDSGARRMVPMHHGTFRVPFEPMVAPARRLGAEWARRGLPPERLWTMRIGDRRDLQTQPRPRRIPLHVPQASGDSEPSGARWSTLSSRHLASQTPSTPATHG